MSDTAPPTIAAGPMPSWISHKIVQADRIKAIVHNAQNLPESVITDGGLTIDLPPEIFARGTPVAGQDFIVQYDDGYLSWSPQAVFEAGYSPADTAVALQDVTGALVPIGSPQSPPPRLGVLVHDLGDGTVGIHALEPDGTEHTMVLPEAHGAVVAFIERVRGFLANLGERATSWEKILPAAAASSPNKVEP